MMVQEIERRRCVQVWAASIALHGIGVTVVGLLISQMRPVPLQESFRWNISLVQPLPEHPVESNMEAGPPPTLFPPTQRKHETSSTSHAVGREVRTRPVTAPHGITPVPVQHEPVIAQPRVTGDEVRSIHETRQTEPAPEPVAAEMRTSQINTGESHELPITEPFVSDIPAMEPSHITEVPPVAAMPRESPASATLTESTQPVSKDGQGVTSARTDYGWLIESLGARLAELKQYPATARSSGMQGKVLLRAVIRADGHVAEISVQKSSGYEELDMAAMQTMHNASPLHSRHELGRPQIAVTIALVYKLAN